MAKIRPFRPSGERQDNRTEAQKAATDRNFGIFKLRGLWAQAAILREPYRSGVRGLIDADLIARGAKAEQEHRAEIRERTYAKLKRDEHGDDIPF